jgi:hypothetical protein
MIRVWLEQGIGERRTFALRALFAMALLISAGLASPAAGSGASTVIEWPESDAAGE